MDYKFWITFSINLAGVLLVWRQLRIMKREVPALPSPRSAKRLKVEQQLARKLYVPVFVMVGLVLLSWLPYVIAPRQAIATPVVMGWTGAENGCVAVVDTSSMVRVKDRDRLFLACSILDPTVDPMEDNRIAISKPFNITGGAVQISILYGPSDPIVKVAKVGSQTKITAFLLPKSEDGSVVRRLSDIAKAGGEVVDFGSSPR
jgi:hypothetical protein